MTSPGRSGSAPVLASMKFHGVVVATMYGIPAFNLVGTTKNRNWFRRLDRPDLSARFDEADLADRVRLDIPPVPASAVAALRSDAVATLDDLRTRLAAL